MALLILPKYEATLFFLFFFLKHKNIHLTFKLCTILQNVNFSHIADHIKSPIIKNKQNQIANASSFLTFLAGDSRQIQARTPWLCNKRLLGGNLSLIPGQVQSELHPPKQTWKIFKIHPFTLYSVLFVYQLHISGFRLPASLYGISLHCNLLFYRQI